jgi:hypothetical protein
MATEATKIPFVEAAAPSTPAASRVVVYAKSDGLMYSKDDAGAETLMSSGGAGSVATDAIWDAAGDLAVGTGANTAAKLSLGAAGGQLARINGAVAWNAGTSFPTAAAGDVYHRTDLDIPFWRYDGTRWLCTCLHGLNVARESSTSLSAASRPTVGAIFGTHDVFVERLSVAAHVVTTNDGSNYWTAKLQRNVLNTWNDVGSGVNTSALSPDDWALLTEDINSAVTLANVAVFGVLFDKVGSPGNLLVVASAWVRYIGT